MHIRRLGSRPPSWLADDGGPEDDQVFVEEEADAVVVEVRQLGVAGVEELEDDVLPLRHI